MDKLVKSRKLKSLPHHIVITIKQTHYILQLKFLHPTFYETVKI
jgi:hypothetical protein